MTYEEMIASLLDEARRNRTAVEVVMTRNSSLEGKIEAGDGPSRYLFRIYPDLPAVDFTVHDVKELTIRRVGVGFSLTFRQS